MGATTEIAWADATFNPWIGCTKVSPGCANCYAERDFKRKPAWSECWGPGKTRKRTSEAYWWKPLAWDSAANVWIGATCEDQAAADSRIPDLLRIPARVRFLSCEPLHQDKDWHQHVPFKLRDADNYQQDFERVGRRIAGRLLDGRTWDEFPKQEGGKP